MKQCPDCGVELGDDVVRCPLCGASLASESSLPAESGSSDADATGEGDRPEPYQTQKRRARFWLWEMFTIVLVATAIIVAAADFAYGFDLSWSVFPLTSLAFIWIFITVIIVLGRDIPLAYASETIALLVYLYVLDVLIPGDSWFVPFALPITLLVAVMGGAAAGTARGLKLSVLQTMAVSVFFVGLFVVGLEVILYFALDLESILSWSIVAFGGCLSIGLLLLLINKRLRERHADFKRVFHL